MTLLSECYHAGFQSSDFIREQVSFLKRTAVFQPIMNLWPMTCRPQLSFKMDIIWSTGVLQTRFRNRVRLATGLEHLQLGSLENQEVL